MKAIILGATSGIGRALAGVLSRDGYTLGLAGRRIALLEELKTEFPPSTLVRRIDIANQSTAMEQLAELIAEMGGVDLVVVSSGVGFLNDELDWEKEKTTIDVNVAGFSAMVNVAWRHFEQAGRGHLVGISSIAALRGNAAAPAYSASKAFESIYLEGLRLRAMKANVPITVTEIQPGFVDTAMAQGEGLFWVASPDEAARQIYRAIRRKSPHAYVTRRWRLIAWLLRRLPESVLARM